MPEEMTVSFAGPFSWSGTSDAPSLFDAEERRGSGVYLWTVALPEGHLIYYVGETGRSFGTRFREHYLEHAAAMYHVYSPAEFACGEKVALWPGHFDAMHRKSEKECITKHGELCEQIQKMTLMFRFFLAPIYCEDRIRRRIEAAIAQALYAAPGIIGAFQDRGVRYNARTSNEDPIRCRAISSKSLLGLPERFLA